MSRRGKTLRRPARILVPSDSSESSAAALDYAHSLGKGFGARVEVLRLRGHQELGALCATILGAASSQQADLIVVGLNENTHLSHIHTRSADLARSLAQQATCPVISVQASLVPAQTSAPSHVEEPYHE